MALVCFNAANLDPQADKDSEIVNGHQEKFKKLEVFFRTGGFDVFDWILSDFRGKSPNISKVYRCSGHQEV